MSADPYRASGGAADPASWNRYAFERNDPVNNYDPNGLETCKVTGLFTTYSDPDNGESAVPTVAGVPTYSYDAKNKRISTLHADGTEELFFYGPNGRKLSTIHLSPYTDSGPTNNIIYFADRIVANSSGALIQDRRCSIGAYDPWGEDPNNTGNDTEKFATYTRDNATGLD